jgi:hypothetical protein
MLHTNKGFCKTGQVLLEDTFHVVPLKVATIEKKCNPVFNCQKYQKFKKTWTYMSFTSWHLYLDILQSTDGPSMSPVNTFNDLIQINLCDKTTEKANERELLQPDACGIRNYIGISELRQKTVIALESLNLSLMQKKRLHQCNTPEKLMENIISLI